MITGFMRNPPSTTKYFFRRACERYRSPHDLLDERTGVGHSHAPNLFDGKSAIEQTLREHRKTCRDRRVDGLAKIRRENAMFGPRLANRREHAVPRRLPGVHGGEAVLDECAHLREFVLLISRKILRRKLGVSDHNSLRAHPTGGFYERKNFRASDVSRC